MYNTNVYVKKLCIYKHKKKNKKRKSVKETLVWKLLYVHLDCSRHVSARLDAQTWPKLTDIRKRLGLLA